MQICRTLQSNKKHTRNDLNIHIDVSLDKVWLIHGCMFLYFFGHRACGILVPQQGIKPSSSSLQAGFLTARPPQRCIDGSSDVCRDGEAQVPIMITTLIMYF